MSQERTYTIQIRMSADTAAGAEAAAVLEQLQQRSSDAGVSLKDFLNSVGQMPGNAAKPIAEAGEGMRQVGEGADKMSKADVNNLLLGLRTSIAGLASGDPGQALGGVASGLARVTSSLPSAAIAGAAAAATLAIVKIIGSLVDASKADLNTLGETVDEEMARLEAWAAQDFEFSGLVKSFDAVDTRMAQSQKAADTLKAALDAIFKSKEEAQLSEMVRQAKAAEDSGDTATAEAIRQQIEQQRIFNETISTLVAIETKRADDAAAQVGLQESESALREIQEKSGATNQRLEDLLQTLQGLGLRGEWAKPGSEYLSFLEELLKKRVDIGPNDQMIRSFMGPMGGAKKDIEDAFFSQLQSFSSAEGLLNVIREYPDLIVAAAKQKEDADAKQKAYAESYAAATDSANQLEAEIKQLETRLGALKSQLKDTDFAAAQEAALRQIDALADAMQRGDSDPGTDPDQIWENAKINADSFSLVTTSVEDAISKLKGLFDEIYATDVGQDIQPLVDQARKFRELIDTLGTVEQQTSIGTVEDVLANLRQLRELRGELEDGASEVEQGAASAADDIRSATGQFGTAMSQGGDELVRAAQSLDTKANVGLENMKASANALSSAMSYFSSTASSMLRQIEAVARMAAETERKTSFLERQIINNR